MSWVFYPRLRLCASSKAQPGDMRSGKTSFARLWSFFLMTSSEWHKKWILEHDISKRAETMSYSVLLTPYKSRSPQPWRNSKKWGRISFCSISQYDHESHHSLVTAPRLTTASVSQLDAASHRENSSGHFPKDTAISGAGLGGFTTNGGGDP